MDNRDQILNRLTNAFNVCDDARREYMAGHESVWDYYDAINLLRLKVKNLLEDNGCISQD